MRMHRYVVAVIVLSMQCHQLQSADRRSLLQFWEAIEAASAENSPAGVKEGSAFSNSNHSSQQVTTHTTKPAVCLHYCLWRHTMNVDVGGRRPGFTRDHQRLASSGSPGS